MTLTYVEIGSVAARYVTTYGERANARIGDDISRAIGMGDWDEAHRLQRALLRMRRLELGEQIAQRMTADAARHRPHA